MKHSPIQSATLSFNEEGTPVSREFDDVYFSRDNGLEETRYVFLDGNQLPARFMQHPRSLFVVAESGFGTGLNFLALWQAFDTFRQHHPTARLQRLHYISFEKYPLTAEDLRRAHEQWPQLAPQAQVLQQQWPLPLPGCQRLLLDGGRVTLDLWFGDINTLVDALDDSHNQQVDAWFLDGFAPAKNPDMWSDKLFQAMARMARPGGTLATFTAAGFVRRGLLQAGFNVSKRKGFGRKREMLTGIINDNRAQQPGTPWYARPAASQQEAALTGGGIASAMLALMLLRRGWQVTLYCADDAPARKASGNRQGALYPLLSSHDPALASFFPAAFTFARQLYDTLPVEFDHAWCGVTQLGWDEKSRQKIKEMSALNLPHPLVALLDMQQTEQQTGLATGCESIHYPPGGWLCPAQLTAAALALGQQQGLTIHYRHTVCALQHEGNTWQLTLADGSVRRHAVVVLANGHQINQFSQSEALPVYPVAGQVSHIPTSPGLSKLRQVLCYDGYLTPQNPKNGHHCIGASYHRGDTATAYRQDDQEQNRQRLINCLPNIDWPQEVDISAGDARCAVRCATRDHLPMVGNVPDYQATLEQYATLAHDRQTNAPVSSAPYHPDLFMLGALGARGLCSAPLAAETLAAQMSAEPLPLDKDTLAALNPNRLWVRKLLRGKAVK